jgi:glycosyltransferase involved in cell wall biosynthesis
LIDIILAVYNGENYLKQQIESIFAQTYTDWELIIHDDGSTDNSIGLIKQFVSDKIKFIQDDIIYHNSTSNFINTTVKYARHGYICFADQDDIWEKDKLAIELKKMKELELEYGENIPICIGSDLCLINNENTMIYKSFYNFAKINNKPEYNDLTLENSFTGCTMMFNKAVIPYLDKVVKLNELKSVVQHDWLIALICASDGIVNKLNIPTVRYRQHAHNTIGAKKYTGFFFFHPNEVKKKMVRMKELQVLIHRQLILILKIINNENKIRISQEYIWSNGLKHKIIILKYKLNYSRTLTKFFAKLFVY